MYKKDNKNGSNIMDESQCFRKYYVSAIEYAQIQLPMYIRPKYSVFFGAF